MPVFLNGAFKDCVKKLGCSLISLCYLTWFVKSKTALSYLFRFYWLMMFKFLLLVIFMHFICLVYSCVIVAFASL